MLRGHVRWVSPFHTGWHAECKQSPGARKYSAVTMQSRALHEAGSNSPAGEGSRTEASLREREASWSACGKPRRDAAFAGRTACWGRRAFCTTRKRCRSRKPNSVLWTTRSLLPAKAVPPMQACALHLCHRTPRRCRALLLPTAWLLYSALISPERAA